MSNAKNIILCLLALIILINIQGHLALNIRSIEKSKYARVLKLSFLFYEAQRSGKLPKNNRILWRGDSALGDHGELGEDLIGGYYDAGDSIKLTFTIASTATLLAWGGITWPEAYIAAGQYDELRDAIKWATDFLIKCHVSDNVLYGQIGDYHIDHRFWGRPEELDTPRPVFKIDAEKPGSDLAGETAAALAAASIIFRNNDPEYSNECLKHARQLYKFAFNYRGYYHKSVKVTEQYFTSSGYGDELAWAAAWLYKATKESEYFNDAEDHYLKYDLDKRPETFFFDNKTAGVQVLLAQLTGRSDYIKAAREFCDYSINKQKRTLKGLVYINKTGTLSHAANIALICLELAEIPGIDNSQQYRSFAKQQIDYMLGSGGQSYVVGYGKNPPTQPYHASSSCPNLPSSCGWSTFEHPGPNAQILYGALVSGPDEIDKFYDIREDHVYTDVAIDFNAGFTSALSGLLHLQMNKK